MKRLRRRLRVEVALAVISAALCVLTFAFPEWIEESTGLEPDAGSGALEWIIAGVFLAAALVSAVLARRDYRRLACGCANAFMQLAGTGEPGRQVGHVGAACPSNPRRRRSGR
jgi:hypothetical protein